MKDMILFPEDIDRLNIILDQLTVKANLLLAVLINKDGRLLTFQGKLDKIDTVSMAALVAGNSASTLAIANLMGETEFSAMYHQGKNRHIYIAVVDDNTFLCLVFDERTNIDRVKVFVRQFDRQIKKALIQVYDKTEDQVDLDLGLGFPEQDNASLPMLQGNSGGKQSFLPEKEISYHKEQPEIISMKSDIHHDPFSSMPSIKTMNDHAKSSDLDDAVYLPGFQAQNNDSSSTGEVQDTNYLYLKKKIQDTVKRKKDP